MKKILSIIDMQEDFTRGVLGNKECINVISKIVDIINNGNFDAIVLTRDTHDDNYMNSQEGKFLPVIHCIKNTNAWQVVKEITEAIENKQKVNPNLIVEYIDKPTFGSFDFADNINNILKKFDDKCEIYFTGVCTGICVISNVILTKTKCKELPVHVIENACACVTPNTHTTAINAMKTLQVYID